MEANRNSHCIYPTASGALRGLAGMRFDTKHPHPNGIYRTKQWDGYSRKEAIIVEFHPA